MRQLLLICASLLVFTSCQTNNSFNKKAQQLVADSVASTLKRYYSDIKVYGLTAELSYLDSSDAFFWVPPGYTSSIDYNTVREIIVHSAPTLLSVENTWDSLHVLPLAMDLASYTGKLHSTITDTANRVTTVLMIETGLLIKRKNGWKLLNGQTTILQ